MGHLGNEIQRSDGSVVLSMNFVGNFVGNFVERVVGQGNECSVEIAQGNPVRGGIVVEPKHKTILKPR